MQRTWQDIRLSVRILAGFLSSLAGSRRTDARFVAAAAAAAATLRPPQKQRYDCRRPRWEPEKVSQELGEPKDAKALLGPVDGQQSTGSRPDLTGPSAVSPRRERVSVRLSK